VRAPGSRLGFVMLTIGRSGSTHLGYLLDSHPEIRFLHEVFNPEIPPEPFKIFVNSGYDDALRYVEDTAASVPERVVGLKLPWSSLFAFPVTVALLADPNLKVILSTREDRLEQYMSSQVAAATGVWHSYQGEQAPGRVRLDPERYCAWVKEADFGEAMLTALARHHPTFALDYLELAAGGRLTELQQFLGVDPVPLRSDSVKLRDRSAAETIENWDEFAAAVRQTPASRTLPPE
jgi:hypothetical protein